MFGLWNSITFRTYTNIMLIELSFILMFIFVSTFEFNYLREADIRDCKNTKTKIVVKSIVYYI